MSPVNTDYRIETLNAYLYAYVSVNYSPATLPAGVLSPEKYFAKKREKTRAIYYSRELKMTQDTAYYRLLHFLFRILLR